MILWTIRPFSSPDMKKVHPVLSSLEAPYKKVDFYYWMDGGSVGISITDNKGKVGQVCIPRPMGESDVLSRNVYIGNTHYTFDKSTELKGFPDTKIFIANLLRNKENPTLYSDRECMIFSRRVRDFITFMYRRYTKDDTYIYHENENSIY